MTKETRMMDVSLTFEIPADTEFGVAADHANADRLATHISGLVAEDVEENAPEWVDIKFLGGKFRIETKKGDPE